MILPLRELDVMGVLIAPFALCLLLAAATMVVLLAALRRSARGAAWARSPALELALAIGVLSAFVLSLGRI